MQTDLSKKFSHRSRSNLHINAWWSIIYTSARPRTVMKIAFHHDHVRLNKTFPEKQTSVAHIPCLHAYLIEYRIQVHRAVHADTEAVLRSEISWVLGWCSKSSPRSNTPKVPSSSLGSIIIIGADLTINFIVDVCIAIGARIRIGRASKDGRARSLGRPAVLFRVRRAPKWGELAPSSLIPRWRRWRVCWGRRSFPSHWLHLFWS